MSQEFIEDDDNVVAMCMDCLTVIPDSIAERDVFLQAGKTGVCKMCGGPVLVTYRDNVERLRAQRESGKALG